MNVLMKHLLDHRRLLIILGLVMVGLWCVITLLPHHDDSLVLDGAYVRSIACARNGTNAMVATADGIVPLTSNPSMVTAVLIPPAMALYDIALSADGSVLAVFTSQNRQFADVDLYRGTTKIKSLHIALELGAGSHLTLNSPGTIVALAGWRETIVWDTTTNTVKRLTNSGAIRSGFTLQDDLVSTNGIIWPSTANSRSDLLAELNEMSGHAFSLAVHPSKSIVAIGAEDGRIRLFDLKQRRLIQTIDSHSGTITALAFNHDGTWLAAGGGWGMEGDNHGEPEIRIWDVATGQSILTLTPPDTAEIGDVCFIGVDDSVLALTQKPWSPFGNLHRTRAHLWNIP